MVRDVDPNTNLAALLVQLNRQATLNALVWDSSDATISARCTVIVHQDIASWIYYVLATAAILQNDWAHSHTVALAKASGGRPAGSNHPAHGARNEPNTSMNVPARMIVPAGEEPSKFVGAQCSGIEGFLVELAETKWWYGNADAEGATVEVPFTGHRPATFQDRSSADARDSKQHWCRYSPISPTPEFGNGALLVTRLPVSPGAHQAVRLANDLNLAESVGGHDVPPLFGAWASTRSPMRTTDSHLPLAELPRNGRNPEQLTVYQATRAQFARRFLDA